MNETIDPNQSAELKVTPENGTYHVPAHMLDSHRIGATRVTEAMPSCFRMAQYPNGRRILQGGRRWWKGGEQGIDWADLEMVKVDEKGQEIVE